MEDLSLKRLNLVWDALIASLAIYGGLGFLLPSKAVTATQVVTTIFFVESVIACAVGWWLLLRTVNSTLAQITRARAEGLPQGERGALQRRLAMYLLISLALFELPAVSGLILALQGAQKAFLSLLLLSAVSLILARVRGFPLVQRVMSQLDTVAER